MKVLLLDNYDSFTYNLEYYLKGYVSTVDTIRNDKITPEECLTYDAIVLSPGPGLPETSGHMPDIIATCAGKVPILGICLGHQAIGQYLGTDLINLKEVYHGKKTKISRQTESGIFTDLPQQLNVGRYHSWSLNPESISDKITVTAISEDGQIMAIQNEALSLYGLQFHPESILTCLLYTSPSPRDKRQSRMPSSA